MHDSREHIMSMTIDCLEILRRLVLLGDAQMSKIFTKEHGNVPHVINVL